jgi:hypothetical protein
MAAELIEGLVVIFFFEVGEFVYHDHPQEIFWPVTK